MSLRWPRFANRPRSWMRSFPGTRVLRRLVRIRLELATRDIVGVLLDVGVPLLGQVVQREDRRNGTNRNAGAAVDALNRVDEELVYRIEPRPAVFVLRVLFRMDAIDRAGVHAGGVFRSDAGFGNDIRHSTLPKTAYLQLYHTRMARVRLRRLSYPTHEHDLVIDRERFRKRKKKPSERCRND